MLVCNPGSGGGRGGRRAGLLRRLLSEAGAEFEWSLTRDMSHAQVLAREAAAEGFDAVVAVGGDGTINRVLNGLLGAAERTPAAGLGVLYAGTSPDFCRYHRIPTDPRRAVGALLGGGSCAVDVCRMEHGDGCGGRRVTCFASSANLGLGAGIAARANRYRRYLGDFAGTLLATVTTVLRSRRVDCRLVLDGHRELCGRTLNLTVGKNRFLAGGLDLGVGCRPGDGRLFFCFPDGLGRLGLLMSLPRLYAGGGKVPGRFRWGRAVSMSVRPAAAGVRVECDGDPVGWCPLDIQVLPAALRLLGAGG
jgi:diacylglycerol kinase family enzyme